jgi:ketosteroid isomerase-like protein
MKNLLSFIIAFGFTQPVFSQNPTPVIEAEKAFAKHAIDHSTKQAFLKYMDSNAVVFNRGVISNGIQSWINAPENDSKLIWGPSYAAIAKSNDLGFTTGAFEFRVNDTLRGSGQYTTIWSKTLTGEWKFLVDLGVSYRPSQWGQQPLSNFNALTPADAKDTSVMELENKFIQAFASKGYKAYESVIDKNSWLNFDRHVPLFHAVTEQLSFIPAELKFSPVQGKTASSRDFAYVYGVTELNGKKENYLRVWGHTNTGWKLLVQVLKWQN